MPRVSFVAGVIETALQAAEVRRAVERPRRDPTAYDLNLRAFRAIGSWDKQDHMEALDRLSRATKKTLPTAQPWRYPHGAIWYSTVAVGPMTLRQPAKGLSRLPAAPFATPATMPRRSVELPMFSPIAARILMWQQPSSIGHYVSIRASPTGGNGARG